MRAHIIRRIAHGLITLLGVNLTVFALFFYVNPPDRMAEQILGERHATPERIESWKRQHGYHLPRLFNADERFPGCFTRTVFWTKSMPLFAFQFGSSDHDNSAIGAAMRERIPYSLALTVPIFALALAVNLILAMVVAFHRGSGLDHGALVVCVFMMSVSMLFYIVGGQYLFAIRWKLAPVSGFDSAFPHALRFLILPIGIGVVGSIGAGTRYYRTVFLEEIHKDYIRTARAKGLGEGAVLFRHALKNALLPILTNVVVGIPFLIMGNLLLENFFGIPGLGSFLIDAIMTQDFAVIRAMVFLGSALYVAALILIDIAYTWADPRVRFA